MCVCEWRMNCNDDEVCLKSMCGLNDKHATFRSSEKRGWVTMEPPHRLLFTQVSLNPEILDLFRMASPNPSTESGWFGIIPDGVTQSGIIIIPQNLASWDLFRMASRPFCPRTTVLSSETLAEQLLLLVTQPHFS